MSDEEQVDAVSRSHQNSQASDVDSDVDSYVDSDVESEEDLDGTTTVAIYDIIVGPHSYSSFLTAPALDIFLSSHYALL
ncbi:hypothetical protein IFR05_002712 [Cadophora sp. M221]|nr:hypothetical protein IFR05_002712 [Cadophora sp. M221]